MKSLVDVVFEKDAKEALELAMRQHLDDRECRLLAYRYGLGRGQKHSLAECGRFFGVSRTRIYQLEYMALRKLRAKEPELKKYVKGWV